MDAPRPTAPPVLVVDDCPYLAEALALLLKWWGYRPAVAHDGPSALALASAEPPAAVLLDLGLPGMDGCDLAARLRGLPGMGKALLVALTGYGEEEEVRRCYQAGFDLHLLKPCNPEEIRRAFHGRFAAGPTR
jgi:CheY-like chemotaxis protein